MALTYLPRFTHFLFWLGLFLSWVLSLTSLFMILIITYASCFALFRRSNRDILDGPAFSNEVLFSPINGKVISIRRAVDHAYFGKDMNEIRIASSWFNEMGIYLPFSSEVKDINVRKGNTFFRYRKIEFFQKDQMIDSLSLTLENDKEDSLGVQFVKCKFGAWPEVALMPGDRGIRHANIGYFPFGGTVICYVPNNYEVLVEVGGTVKACESLIAGLPKR